MTLSVIKKYSTVSVFCSSVMYPPHSVTPYDTHAINRPALCYRTIMPMVATPFVSHNVMETTLLGCVYFLCTYRMDLSTLAKLVLVVAAVLGLTASRCDNLENSAAVCNMLYQQMEAALLKEPENLYKLRQTFFPNSQAEPTVVGVVFSLHLNNVSSELCSDDGMNSSLDSLHLPQKFFWSSSVVIAALNPRILELFTPELLYLIDKQTSTYYDYNVDDLILILDIDSLSCSPSSDEILNGLMDLTTQVGLLVDIYEHRYCTLAPR